jgi:DNA/RNA endonuclease G (NUC1)
MKSTLQSSFTRKLFPILVGASALFFAVSQVGAIIGTSFQMQLGNPSGATANPTNHDHYLIQRTVETIDYSDNLGEPNWASWDLTTADEGSATRSTFITDTNLPSGFYEVTSDDYTNSGYDRGHMCPSADRTDTQADNDLVFYMSNIVPQQDDLNTGPWEAVETYCRTLAAAGNELLITCGPSTFDGSRIQPSGKVSIPGYTWKIVVVVPSGSGSAISRITSTTRVITVKMPNLAGIHSVNWTNYITCVNRIQADTGYTFFTALSSTIASALRAQVDGGVDHYPSAGKVVISQVYGGGGNSGATYKNDFIELYNSGSAAVDLSTYAVQYASATGSSWSETTLSGSIAAGHYYLIQEAAGSGGTQNLPTPDATGTISMAATAGKVALTSTTTLLAVSNPVGGPTVVDFVGYGTTANAYEGSGPAPAPSATVSDLRANGGATDTDNNAADFATGAVNPRNSGAGGGSGGTVVISQVYGGGGNSGATYKNDFIELYNSGSASVDLSTYAVQYAGATSSTWSETLLTGSLAAGHYYLIQEAAGSGGTQNLPTPEATGTINLAATAGKVALTKTQTLLTVDNPVGGANVVDFIGYGTTADAYEGSGPAPAPSNTTADLRANGGATDTNNNAADFTAGAPNPRD